MTIDRRQALALMASGATAMLAPPAFGADEALRFDGSAGVALNLPKDASPIYTAAAPRPNGGLLWAWVDTEGLGGGYLRAFNAKLKPDPAGRTPLFNGVTPGLIRGWSVALASFPSGASLFFHIGLKEGAPTLLVTPVASNGSVKAPIEIAEGGLLRDVFATSIRGDKAVVTWRSVSQTGPEIFDLHWRVVSIDGSLPGETSTVERPQGTLQQTPLALTTLASGGAALGFYRSEDFDDDKGPLFVQRIRVSGAADGAPMTLGARGGYLALAGLRVGGLLAARPGPNGTIKARLAKPGRGFHPEVTIDTGLDKISADRIARFGLQATHVRYGGALLLVSGSKGNRSVASALLIDELGRLVHRPTVVASMKKTPGDGSGLRAMQAVTLVTGDVFLAWSDGTTFDPGPTRGVRRGLAETARRSSRLQ